MRANIEGFEAEAASAVYVLDAGLSSFSVQAFAGGVLSAVGHNPTIAIREISGVVRFDPGNPNNSALRLVIDSKSLEVTDQVSDKDRREIERIMQATVLQSDAYPEIPFQSMRVTASRTQEGQYWMVIQGQLTIRGVTRSQNIDARVFVNGDLLTAQGTFSILQSDYGIERVSVAGGALKVKDELKFDFNIVARKQG